MGCCECCSMRCTCSWTAGVLVNLVFVASIAVSYFFVWPLSLALSIVYPVILFFWIRRYESSDSPLPPDIETANEAGLHDDLPQEEIDPEATPSTATEEDNEQIQSSQDSAINDTAKASPKRVPVALSLLYALFALSLGAPGEVLFGNVLPCSKANSYHGGPDPSKSTWTTDVAALPKAVQKWDQVHKHPSQCNRDGSCVDSTSMFAQMDGTLYFSGSINRTHAHLLALSDLSGPPRQVGDFRKPHWLTTVADKYICFLAKLENWQANLGDDDSMIGAYYGNSAKMYCGKGADDFKSLDFKLGVVPINLFAFDGMLWFQQTYPISGSAGSGYEMANGYAIVSVDPQTMVPTSHSILHPPKDSPTGTASTNGGRRTQEVLVADAFEGESGSFEDESVGRLCDHGMVTTLHAIVFIFFSALPVTIFSGWLWIKKGIPSSSITLFVGLALCLSGILAISDPWGGLTVGAGMWYIFAGPVWIVLCTYVLSINTRVDPVPLKWSVYFLTVQVFCIVLASLCGADYSKYMWVDDFGIFGISFIAWLLVFVPFGLIAILLDSTFILVQAAVGTLVDVGVGTVVELVKYPIVAGVLVVVEVFAIVAAFIKIYCKRRQLRSRILSSLKNCTRHVCNVTDEDEDKDATESLLRDDGEAPVEGTPEGEMT